MALESNDKTYDVAPNTGNIFDQQTSFQEDLFDSVAAHGGGEMGVGSFKQRSVEKALVEYEPYKTAVNTFIMLQGQSETVDNVVHEWGEDDLLMDYESAGIGATVTDADTVINNSDGASANTYVPAPSGTFELAADGGLIFRKHDRIRYADSTGGYAYALVTNVSGDTLTLESFGGNLPAAASEDAEIAIVDNSYGSDLNYDPQPRGSNPSMKYTYLQKQVGFGSFTERSVNEANSFDQALRAQEQAMEDMNFKLEKGSLFGKRGKVQHNGDWVYSTPGLWESQKEAVYQTDYLTDTSGDFDPAKFKEFLYDFTAVNFGAESGAPPIRQGFIDGRFSNMLDQAFEDKQRFYGNEFMGGVKVNRWEISDGAIDFVRAPIFEMMHPTPDGSLRTGTSPRAVMLMIPIQECAKRFTFKNEGLRDDIYKQNGGDEEMIYRLRYTTGVGHKLRQYGAAFQEVANPN